MDAPVAVIIAAYRAGATIGAAVRTALADPRSGEVIVVDDASGDGTVDAARAADDGSGRLTILVQDTNAGPAAARNRAIATTQLPFVAILDSDDVMLPGRFDALLTLPAWDLVADNIAFVTRPPDLTMLASRLPGGNAHRELAIDEFVRRNISVRGRARAELGFLKPVMRRSFLIEHGLAYAAGLRLGEDFILYVRALAAGARFRIAERCGYVAIERPGSLSGRHRTSDLVALHAASRAITESLPPGSAGRAAMAAQARSIAVKAAHRQLLDTKRAHGMVAALADLARTPALAPAVAGAIMADKRAGPVVPAPPELRLLFGPEDFAVAPVAAR